MSVNWKSSVDHCVANDYWSIVNCYIQNVVDIFKTLMMHQPHWGEPNLHLLFLIMKLKVFSNKDRVWFMKILVDKNMIWPLSKWLTKIFSLIGKNYQQDWKRYVFSFYCLMLFYILLIGMIRQTLRFKVVLWNILSFMKYVMIIFYPLMGPSSKNMKFQRS